MKAVECGKKEIVKILLQSDEGNLNKDDIEDLVVKAVRSDCNETLMILLEKVKSSYEMIFYLLFVQNKIDIEQQARDRGNREMINMMKEQFKIRIDEAEIVDEDINSFLNCIPKHQEVDYVDIKKNIMKLIKKHDDNIISYERLLSEVVCSTIHHNQSTCPLGCSVTAQCDSVYR